MKHRHIHDDDDVMIAGIEDVIVRGDHFSQQRLFRRVVEDPFGDISERLQRVVESGNEEISSYLAVWVAFLARARSGTVWGMNPKYPLGG